MGNPKKWYVVEYTSGASGRIFSENVREAKILAEKKKSNDNVKLIRPLHEIKDVKEDDIFRN